MITITLKKGREKSVLRKHPWVFSGAFHTIQDNPKKIAEGTVVKLLDYQQKCIATGYYGKGSIGVRILDFEETQPQDTSYWVKKIDHALQKRIQLGLFPNPHTNAWRLVHGEGDLIPGLTLDYYNGVVVFQGHNEGIYAFKEWIVQAIQIVLKDSLIALYHKPKSIPEATIAPEGFWFGTQTNSIVQENQLLFDVNWTTGQKTGFFIDQRESRELMFRYAKGRQVLNTFCYTGGFSVYAAAAGALRVRSVDVSKTAIALCKQNLIQNQFSQWASECSVADTFEVLKTEGNEYDLIILDPPSFAKSMKNKSNALKGYRRLNTLALQKIKPGGILFTFSCTQVVDRASFESTLFASALDANRQVSIINRTGQPPDHPLNLFHPESEYLKGLVLLVE